MKTIMKILVVKRESQIPCAEVQSVGVCVCVDRHISNPKSIAENRDAEENEGS